MDASEVRASSFSEIFNEACPYYMALGMSYEQFWYGEPEIVIAYRKAEELRKRRVNEELWLCGIYTAEALSATVGNMFSKGTKHKYPSDPKPITMSEVKEREERERKRKQEEMKAKFMARALSVNAKKEVGS